MIIFGYDKILDGEVITNGFEFKDGVSPVNLGFAGYITDENTTDDELDNLNKR